MSRPDAEKPLLVRRTGGDLELSGEAFLTVMEAVLANGASFRFKARGFSMTPFIRDGDIVTVLPRKDRIPGTGDVVAFVNPGTRKLMVHRIIGMRGDSYTIKGDNRTEMDGTIPGGQILGIASKVERNGRIISLGNDSGKSLATGLNRIGFLIPALIRIARGVRSFWRRFKT